jgi:hypothetical protein
LTRTSATVKEASGQDQIMPRFRAMVATLIALSLAIVPAHAGAYAAGMTAVAATQTSNCSPCPMTHAADGPVSMTDMPMSGGCHDMDGKGGPKGGAMTPSACAVFCNGLIALPSPALVMAEIVSAKLLGSFVQPTLAGHIDPPEPYPPKR